ncbi:glycoside hydrolase family 31 protein [Mucilaginibacter paludis]|uniref:Glycoside hydrolase family 31 n=1 Tax=Mucilaginibacter paludis DSM 18603 TaxID=714943 RepID=H1YFS1_9SPHI|nr:TIM-barrel domain-containing protein [Mucilaginibacter paludis]EHQ25312.1 glycoside hydrolase family 31 [Mucilaginibacter paludis DSM 18603]
MIKKLVWLLLIPVFTIPSITYGRSDTTHYVLSKQGNGIVLSAGTRKLSIQFNSASMVRVRYVPNGEFKDNGTEVCVPRKFKTVPFMANQISGSVILKSAVLKVVISTQSGFIQYFDRSGKMLLSENPTQPRLTEKIVLNKSTFNDAGSQVVKTANGDQFSANITAKQAVGTALKARQQFVWQPGEALYGLGSHQEDHMNLRGTSQYLYQYNLKKSMPVLMSSKGYGLLFDAGSAMIFHDDHAGSFMEMLAVNQVDYYFMYGPEFDQIIHQFRTLTGKVELPPKYIFGYVQSKERYVNQHEVDSVVTRFRGSHIPLDVIVQDWLYWKDGLWGYKKFDAQKYPSPQKMIDDVHQQNAHFMLSIWPQLAAEEEKEMGDKGLVLGRRIYDAYSPAGRNMYWDNYVYPNLFTKGVDAWWCDSSEPVEADWNRGANDIAGDATARFVKNVKVMADLLGEERVNTFSLHHAMGIYQNQRKTGSDKRVVNLTRASFPGQQRYGTMVWNGDTKATWADFKSWIPGGLNYMVTGSPYWTIDAGAFFVRTHVEWFGKGEFPKGTADNGYKEFYVRNIQYSQWLPLFRSHGTDFAREPWRFGAPGDLFYDAILKQINLRYRLLPYTYSVAAMVTRQDYTMTRSLLFDFRKDNLVYNIKDQFMFGGAFLVCPVTSPMYYAPGDSVLNTVNKSRTLYLPAGTKWFDFWTGKQYQGGNTIVSAAPIDHIPVFVKAGSIVPMGPVMQYSAEKPDAPWEIRVYPGADGKFTIYEDEGDNYHYTEGKFATWQLSWNDKIKELMIEARKGAYTAMKTARVLHVVLVKEGVGIDLNEGNGRIVEYDGKKVTVRL